ncbi:MAG: ATP-binding protein [Myxococcota bacterium]|nr:ATP-binding protein [Myxococcota bacterium]
MNPSSTLRWRRLSAVLAAGWALLALGLSVLAIHVGGDVLQHPFADTRLGGAAVVVWATPEAEAAGLEAGDRVLAVDGVPYSDITLDPGHGLRPGVPVTYSIEKREDGRRVEVRAPPAPVSEVRTPFSTTMHLLLLVVAGIYMVAGGVVWWLRPGKTGAWALLLFCCAMAAQLATTIHTDQILWAAQRMLVNIPLLGATAFHLFTTYPIEPAWVVRHRRVQLLPYGAALVLAAAGLLAGPLGFPVGPIWTASFFFTVAIFTVSLAVLGAERKRHGEGPMKDAADVVFVSALVSFVPVLLLLVAEWVLQTPLPYFLALLWVFVFPVAAGVGIVRRQLFDVRNVARSSAIRGLANLGITLAFAVGITLSDTLVARFGIDQRSAQVALLFVAILAFNPVRSRMQTLVDRFFDRDRAAYRVAVREISEAMVSMLSLNEIADRILVALTDTMGVERAMVLLADENGRLLRPIASRGDWEDGALETEIPSDHPIWKHLWMRREDLARVDFDEEHDVENREACRDVFDTLEIELLVPILYGVDLLGVIAVSRKLSGDRLEPDDRVLLRTLANQSSIAIENAKAFDEIAKLNETLEARVDERTAELRDTQAQLTQAEKMKSLGQLVAGVAHELNNPIGFVHANLQLLDEYIRKLVEGQRTESDTQRAQEAITKLLERSREGTQRVKKIVQDLRTFSRMDQAELQDTDLHEEIGRTLRLMEPRLKDNIKVELDFGEIPRVRCYAGQLNQVFLNLLMNACDAIGKDGTIVIRTRPIQGGVRLEFRDDGPGIPEEVRNRIFDPFFTTKPVGVGTGLGLSLSHGIIERHDGRIWLESEPGQGTAFFIELPLDATPPDGER